MKMGNINSESTPEMKKKGKKKMMVCISENHLL